MVGTGVAQAQQFNFIGVGEGVPVVSVTNERGIIPEVEGWDLWHWSQMSRTDLFGRTSGGDVFHSYQPDWEEGAAEIGVQTIVAEDRATLNRYSLEQCIDFHNRTLLARRSVDLGWGVTGVVLHHDFLGLPASILYWQMPVNVDGRVRHARIALFGDNRAPTTYPEAPGIAESNSPASVRLGQILDTAMGVLPSGADDPVRAEMDRGLLALAISMVDATVTSGGPGVQAELDVGAGQDAPNLAP